mmetsp:Transcript_38113/g.81221  ORF Transcript_38113/g.81221 Transcript_38113/m.81221 type:complete len:350 (-) Transcript_38113:383-1432(-)
MSSGCTELKAALAQGATVIDLRPVASEEAIDGIFSIVDGSLSAEYDRETGAVPTALLPEFTAPLIVHCKSGRRAAKAISYLSEKGYTNLLNGGGPADEETWAAFEGRVSTYDFGVGRQLLQLCDGQEGTGSSTLTYILSDAHSNEAMIIDPVLEQVDRDLAAVEALGLNLTLALNTHCHADHVTGSGELKKRIPGLRSAISAASGAKADLLVQPHEVILWSSGRKALEVLPTPGHTNGCVSFLSEELKAVFTGDTLLIGGCGRTDFQEGSSEHLYQSVHSQLFSLPAETLVLPAHDYKGRRRSTIGSEKASNPRLTQGLDAFIETMANLGLAYPKHIDRAVPANLVCGC